MRQRPRSSDLSSRSHGEKDSDGDRDGGGRDIIEKVLKGDEVTDEEPSSWAATFLNKDAIFLSPADGKLIGIYRN